LVDPEEYVLVQPFLNDGDGFFRRAESFRMPEESEIFLGDLTSNRASEPDPAPGLDLIVPTRDHPPRFFVLRRIGSQT
jgi:hypothetical protein